MSLANKYRPSDFSSVVGQENVVAIVSKMCQSDTLSNRNFLFTGPAGTGKSTLSKIIAKELNGTTDNIIEIDAASHSGVDDMRELIQQASQYPIGTKYKILVVDECVTGDVEILTDQGFKRFDACDGTERVAQYTDDNHIEFVYPSEWIKHRYCGEMVKWQPREWCSVMMTPHHVQPLFYSKSKRIKDKYISDVKFCQTNNLIVSGYGSGTQNELTPIDRLVIASQADGTIQHISNTYVHWSIQLSKDRKIDRFINICTEGNIPYTEIKGRTGCRRFTYNLPLTSSKELSTHFRVDQFSYSGARDFINEVVQWDGYVTDNYLEYMSTVKSNCDFVAAVGCLGQYSTRQRIQVDNRKDTYKDCHKVFLYDTLYSNCQCIGPTKRTEVFDGLVYCVKVPTQKIVVRSEGFVFVTGNCHSLSNAAWQSMLIGLESQLAMSVFIFCTTNPEKIPETILSRVQSFKLSKLSSDQIYDRLKYVIECENKEGRNITYTEDALRYLSNYAGGGLRDALTNLDKVLAFGNNITTELLETALDLPNYDDYFELLNGIVKRDNTLITTIIDRVYNSGLNFVKWFEGYHSFLCNIVKYIFLRDISKTTIPSHYLPKIEKYTAQHAALCLKLSNKVLQMNKDIRNTQYLQEVALSYLLVPEAPKKPQGGNG